MTKELNKEALEMSMKQIIRFKKILIEIRDEATYSCDDCRDLQGMAKEALEPKYIEQPHEVDCLCDACLPIKV